MSKEKKSTITSDKVESSLDSSLENEVRETLIEFPTQFPIKAIGKHSEELKQAVLAIVDKTIPPQDLLDIKEQMSSHERYMSITIVATFYDKESIDAVYQALTDEKLVIMAL